MMAKRQFCHLTSQVTKYLMIFNTLTFYTFGVQQMLNLDCFYFQKPTHRLYIEFAVITFFIHICSFKSKGD